MFVFDFWVLTWGLSSVVCMVLVCFVVQIIIYLFLISKVLWILMIFDQHFCKCMQIVITGLHTVRREVDQQFLKVKHLFSLIIFREKKDILIRKMP